MDNITVIRSRRKTISLQVDENCRIILRVPNRCSEKTISDFLLSKREWLIKAVVRQEERLKNRLVLTDDQVYELKKLAREYIPKRVEYYAEIMNVKPNGYKITSAKKRFGSCSSKNSLCFSYLLMLYPKDAIDYVVVHELAHIKHHNHQKEFYDFIEEILPDYKERNKLLKQIVI